MNHHLVNLAGCTLTALGGAGSGLLWLTGRAHAHAAGVPMFADIPPGSTDAAGNTMLGGLILGVITLLVNGLFGDRKSRQDAAARLQEKRIEGDARFAAQELRTVQMVSDAKIEALKALAEAKLLADAQILDLKTQLAENRAAGARRDVTIGEIAARRASDPSIRPADETRPT